MSRLVMCSNFRVAAVLLLLGACAVPRFQRVGTAPPADVEIARVELRWSNVYLLQVGDATALVDSGSRGDCGALGAALRARGVEPGEVRVVVITHAHADHAGCARWLQRQGVAIVLGAGDAPVAARGRNDPLRPTGLLAAWLAPMFMFPFEPFTPDIAVDGEIDLGAYGLPELRVVPVPGHTPGSLAVVGGDEAFAGDMMKGGRFAKLGVHTPSEHYYQTDRRDNHEAIAMLLERGVTRFYLGHGGPVDAASVKAWLDDADDDLAVRAASIELDLRGERPRGPALGGGLGVTGGLRVRYGAGRGLGIGIGYLGGMDLRAGAVDGAILETDLHVVGVSLRTRAGAIVAVTGGVGLGGVRGLRATRAPVEFDVELPAGPVRVLARGGVAFRLGGDRYADDALGIADETTALVGLRLGRDHRYTDRLTAGAGPYLALTYRNLGGDELLGIALGFELWGGS